METSKRGGDNPKATELISGRAGLDPRMPGFRSTALPIPFYVATAHKRTPRKPCRQTAVQSFTEAVESGKVKRMKIISHSIILMMKNF